MNVHNLATVVTPNLFRPFELTANDLIFAQHLVETFKIMITDYREVFSVTPEEEEGDGEEEEILLISPNSSAMSPKIVEEDLVGQVFHQQTRKSHNEESGG